MSRQASRDRREFLRHAGVFAVTVAIPTTFWSCTKKEEEVKSSAGGGNAKWQELVTKLEANGIFNAEMQGKWEGKAKAHVPNVTLNEGEGTVELFTDHPMGPEHWITTHYLKNQDGKIIALQEYAGTDPEARHTFEIPEGTTMITAYSHCNKHDDWSAPQEKIG